MNQYGPGYNEYGEWIGVSDDAQKHQQRQQQQQPKKQLTAEGTKTEMQQPRLSHSGIGDGTSDAPTMEGITKQIMQATMAKMASNPTLQKMEETNKAVKNNDNHMVNMQNAELINQAAKKAVDKLNMTEQQDEAQRQRLAGLHKAASQNWENNFVSEEVRKQRASNEFGFSGIGTSVKQESTTKKKTDVPVRVTPEKDMSVQPDETNVEIENNDFAEQTIVPIQAENTDLNIENQQISNWVLDGYNGNNGSEFSAAYEFTIPLETEQKAELMSRLYEEKNDNLGYIGDIAGFEDIISRDDVKKEKSQQLHIVECEQGIKAVYVGPPTVYESEDLKHETLDTVKNVLNDSIQNVYPDKSCMNARPMTYDDFAKCIKASQAFESSTIEKRINVPKNIQPQTLNPLPEISQEKGNEPVFG